MVLGLEDICPFSSSDGEAFTEGLGSINVEATVLESASVVPDYYSVLPPQHIVLLLINLITQVDLPGQEKNDLPKVIQLPQQNGVRLLLPWFKFRNHSRHKQPIAVVTPIIIIAFKPSVLFFKLEKCLVSF